MQNYDKTLFVQVKVRESFIVITESYISSFNCFFNDIFIL